MGGDGNGRVQMVGIGNRRVQNVFEGQKGMGSYLQKACCLCISSGVL